METKFMQKFIQVKDRTITVVGEVDRNSEEKEKGIFLDNKGYLDKDGTVWIYRGNGEPKYNKNLYPYFWLENGHKVFNNPSKFVKKQFDVSNIRKIDLDSIVIASKVKDVQYNEKAITDMKNACSLYIPVLLDGDDFLKKIVKNAIIEKGIDISRLKFKMIEKYILPNMKAALDNKTKMSVNYFTNWMELLGLDYSLRIEDNGTDSLDPLPEPLVYLSWRDKVIKESDYK